MGRPIGLVMQGGGALGAYEWGAVKALVEAGFEPKAVTGVSIGAINAAAIAGGPKEGIIERLDRLWNAITIRMPAFMPEALASEMFSLSLATFGNPAFWIPRTDYFGMWNWTNLCDTSPMRRTLRDICDFSYINNSAHMGFAVTATNIATGQSERFANHGDGRTHIAPEHIIASGALPPGFPMAEIDGKKYWDGGLFDNTPLRPMMDLLSHRDLENLPIVLIDLFPAHGAAEPVPGNMLQLMNRMIELSFENRFWDDYGGPDQLADFAAMMEALLTELPKDARVRRSAHFHKLEELVCLKNLHVIPNAHSPMTGGIDFSEQGVRARARLGYDSVRQHLRDDGFERQERARKQRVAEAMAAK
ncbi:MAG: patatin-like phospholipase family protein [Acetobacteraceae bacterium]